MKYCMRCGQPLVRRWVEPDSRQRDVCGACSTVYYDNPKVLVACAAHFEKRVLLCRRAIMPAKGLWYLVSGFVEAGESVEQAAARELFEETGLSVPSNRMQLAVIASVTHINQIHINFYTRLPVEPRLRIGPEILEARLFSEDEFPFEQFAFSDIIPRRRVEDLYRRIRTGDPEVSLLTYPIPADG